jgi:helicase
VPEIISVEDQLELVPTSKFPLLSFPFESFNPIQSRVIEFYDQPVNAVIAASTSAGKTVCAELFLSHENQKRGGKGMYIGPLKALAQEKIDDWTDEAHEFSKHNLSICTGDYRLTKDRRDELMKSDYVLMTSEMLNSRLRNYRSEQNEWLEATGTLITDEAHLLTVPGRGDKLEVAITKMAALNKACRHVFLSATMPNVDDLAGWLTKLTDRDTVILRSSYRPCPLEMHYVAYSDYAWKYEMKETEKVLTALDIVKNHPKDKFLIFAHTKRTGEQMKKALLSHDVAAEFHNADLDKAARLKLENKFRNDPEFRVIIATSTLAWGLNLPARRVIILGVHRGLSEVATYDIAQMSGRAGRPKYDPKGDVYVLLPSSDQGKQRVRLENPEPIRSQLVQFGNSDDRVLAFHIVSEIALGEVKKIADIYAWYKGTLSAFQHRNLEEHVVEKMIDKLIKNGIIRHDEEGNLEVTPIGRIASLFYYSPYDVADLRRNFGVLFDKGKEKDDIWIAAALCRIDSFRDGIVSNAEMDELTVFEGKIDSWARNSFGGYKAFTPYVIKMMFCYHSILQGRSSPTFAALTRGLQADKDRLMEVVKAIDGMSAKWKRSDYINSLSRRLRYGVSWGLLDLCAIKGIGQVKAEKLAKAGLDTPSKLVANPKRVQAALRCSDKMLDKIISAAQAV